MKSLIVIIMSCVLATASFAEAARSCRPAFEVDAPAGLSGRRASMAQSAGACEFRVRLCSNVGGPECAPRTIRRLVAKNTGVAPLAASDGCGAWSTVTVPATLGRSTRKRLRATGRDQAGRRLRARITLSCKGSPSTTIDDPPAAVGRECGGIVGHMLSSSVDFPPSLPIESCAGGGTSSNYLTPTVQLDPNATEELHVVSVYEGDAPDENGVRHVDVTVRARPKPIVLFLGAYATARWSLHLEPGAVLSRIVTYGVDRHQEIDGVPAGVPIDEYGNEDRVYCMYGWEPGSEECALAPTMLRIRELTGLVETSFQGCYTGREFTVPHSAGPPPKCPDVSMGEFDDTPPLRDVPLPGCESIRQESRYCLTTVGLTVAAVGLDSGTVCRLSNGPSVGVDPQSLSMAWRGDALYTCQQSVGIARGSLSDGSVEVAGGPCNGVTVGNGRLLVAPVFAGPFSRLLDAYDTWADVVAGQPSETRNLGLVENLSADGGVLYKYVAYRGPIVGRTDLAFNASLGDVTLQGLNGTVTGLSATSDGRLVVSGDFFGPIIRVFDASTGALEHSVTPSQAVGALACTDAP